MNIVKRVVVCCLFLSGIEVTLGGWFSRIPDDFKNYDKKECCDAKWVNFTKKGKIFSFMSKRVEVYMGFKSFIAVHFIGLLGIH